MDYSSRLVGLALAVTVSAVFCQNVGADEGSLFTLGQTQEAMASSSSPPPVAKESNGLLPCQSSGCCDDSKWIVETEAVFLWPMQHQNFGSVQFADALDGKSSSQYDIPNDSAFTASPRIAIGVQSDCWGILGRYWQLETGDLEPNTATIAGCETTFPSCLRAKTADLEVTRLFCTGNTTLRASVGCRYAEFDEASGVSFEDYSLSQYYRGEVLSRHEFSGAGVTAGLVGLRPVGDSCFNLFFSGRVSVLWDNNALNSVSTRAGYLGEYTNAYSANDAISNTSASNLFIGELQVGGQWNVPLKCIPANAFFRVGFEYQYWGFGADGGAAAFSAAGPLSGPSIIACGESHGNSHVDMVGFNIGAGLTW
jgi:hypothetical protein